jgi:hypothetical protein
VDASLYLKYIICLFTDIMQSGTSLCTQASHHAISKSGTKADVKQNCHVIWNNQSWDRTEVIAVKKADSPGKQQSKKRKVEDVSQVDSDGNNLCKLSHS